MLWNKGSAAIDTRMDIVTQLIDDNQPDVLTLMEAQLHQDTLDRPRIYWGTICSQTVYTDKVLQPGLSQISVKRYQQNKG